MAVVDITSVVFPIPAQSPFLPSKTTTTTSIAASKASCRTPFLAVTPSLFLAASRLQIRITLETIYEEEGEEIVGKFIETTPSAYSASFLLKSLTCFLEVSKPWSSYSHNCQCF
ncbi:hypothetical protein CsSME_00031352 [Camellia sinensis var. sinensis]